MRHSTPKTLSGQAVKGTKNSHTKPLPTRRKSVVGQPVSENPCNGLPMFAEVCGCASAWRILRTHTNVEPCPMGKPFGCPFRNRPSPP